MTGQIVRLFQDKNFGFVADDRGTDYFFHRSQCVTNMAALKVGDRVTFEVEDATKGPRAVQVNRA